MIAVASVDIVVVAIVEIAAVEIAAVPHHSRYPPAVQAKFVVQKSVGPE